MHNFLLWNDFKEWNCSNWLLEQSVNHILLSSKIMWTCKYTFTRRRVINHENPVIINFEGVCIGPLFLLGKLNAAKYNFFLEWLAELFWWLTSAATKKKFLQLYGCTAYNAKLLELESLHENALDMEK